MNVFDFAMEMEDSGYDYYKNLASTATLPGLMTTFTSLAEDERKHYEIFRTLTAGTRVTVMPQSSALETEKNVVSLRPKGEAGVKGIVGVLGAYKHAMKLEADSFRFYEDAAEKEADDEVKALLVQIAGEEHKHFNIIENIYNFINAPNQHIEWGEFSNLGEFRTYGRDPDI